jgi:hypothetical protein
MAHLPELMPKFASLSDRQKLSIARWRASVSARKAANYYAGINRRFEKRRAALEKFGFVYKKSDCGCYAIFHRERRGKPQNIPAAEVLYATNMVYIDMVLRKYCW